MENASKALIMAGTVIISVLLITMFVYVFREGSRVSENYDRQKQSEQLELYNSKFEFYNRENNTIMDLISVCNLAYDVNESTKSTNKTTSANIKERYTYDNTNAVRIEIKVGGATFCIPDEYIGLERNEIGIGQNPNVDNKMSIYNFANKTLKKLKEDYSITFSIGNDEDTLSTTKLVDNTTIYKFLFKCKEINYKKDQNNALNGQVESMIFEIYENAKYNEV